MMIPHGRCTKHEFFQHEQKVNKTLRIKFIDPRLNSTLGASVRFCE